MFDNEDLKALASQATELHRLIQQVSRHTDQVRQHQYEDRYLDLLTERVGLTLRKSQELFDLITSRILTATNAGQLPDPLLRSILPAASPIQARVVKKIPLSEIIGQVGEPEEGTIRNPDGKRELILLVDDNLDILEGTGSILAFEGYRVVAAKDGPEALRIYRKLKAQIALIILDYFLPVMDGDTVFDELQTLNPEVRVVLSSGFGEQAKLGSMLDRGLRGFIPKPYTADRLVEQVRAILDS